MGELQARKLIGVPVHTKSGQVLGKLVDIEIDALTGRLAFLNVRTGNILSGLMGDLLRVAWSQVLSMSDKEIIVVDGTVPIKNAMLAVAPES